MTKEQLEETEGRFVLVDPERRDILYCMKETSAANNRHLFRFTKNQRNKKSRRLKYLRNKLKPESIVLLERHLSDVPSKTLDSERFVLYLQAGRHVGTQLKNYYSIETLEEVSVYYLNPLDFSVKESGDIYHGKRLLFIARICGAHHGITNLDDYTRYLTLLVSTNHLTQRLTDQDTDRLNEIIKDTTTLLNEE